MTKKNINPEIKNNPEVANHAVFQKLEQFNARIIDVAVAEKLDPKLLLFFKASHDFIKRKIKASLGLLIQISDLNSITSEIETALSNINIFIGDGNPGHLDNAKNQIYSSLHRTSNFPVFEMDEAADLAPLINSYENVITTKISEVISQKNEIEKNLNDTANKIKEKEDEIKRLSDLLVEKETQIQNLNIGFQTDFISFRTTATSQIENDRLNFKKEQDDFKTKIISDSSEFIKDIEIKRDEAKKLVGVIGNIGATGNYQIIANDNKKSADNWRLTAIVFMTILSFLLVCSIWEIADTSYDWHKAIIRIAAVAILIYPATYAARESSKHRKLENLNRKAELELASISPFIASLTNERQQVIKEKLVEKYFGNNDSDDSKSEDKNEIIPVGVLEKFTDQVVKVIKQVNNK